jgi:phenylalanyl-tRNA synthetase, beta subunit
LAFVVPEAVSYDVLLTALWTVNSPLIQTVTIFDVYRGVGLPENMKSMAVKVIFQDAERTLTDDMVEEIVQKLIAAAETVGAQLR